MKLLTILTVALALGLATGASKPVAHSMTPKDERVRLIAPVGEGELRVRPTFCSCGVCFGAKTPVDGLRLEYRQQGAATWQTAAFPYFAETGDYRGSLLDLAEDTPYDVRLVTPSTTRTSQTFRTWKSAVKVAKTIVVDPAAQLPIRIADRGAPDGWVRYRAKPGTTLRSLTKEPVFVVDGATNVLIEGIVFTGSKGRNVITVENSSNVRIVNCEFSHWGRESVICYDGLGRPYEPGFPPAETVRNVMGGFSTKGGRPVNFDGAVSIGRGASCTVVERCWFHDCTINANSWYYSHPSGGEGIVMARPDHSTVIRWCDFTGSDLHRWNDAVESNGNFNENGGFNRDADVYGNFMIYASDDCIELDGGQQNVRCFDNRFESALCGVSIQGCMASPVYLLRNAFFGMCDRFGNAGQTIKTGGGPHGEEARAYVWENLLWGPGSGITMMHLLQADLRRNVFCGKQKIGEAGCSPKSASSGDRFGVALDEARLPTDLPVRPAGFVLDRARFGNVTLKGGAVTPSALKVTAKATDGRDVPFRIAVNDDQTWLKVNPAAGVIPAGGSVELTVTFDGAQMNDRHDYRGVFLVRTPEGFSRGVSVYVETDFVPPFRAEGPGDVAVYAREVGKVALRKGDTAEHAYEFAVPKDGRYYFFYHAASAGEPGSGKGIRAALDGDAPAKSTTKLWRHPVWVPVAPGNRFGNALRFWDFKAGERHVLRIAADKASIDFDGVVMTDNPGAFEPR